MGGSGGDKLSSGEIAAIVILLLLVIAAIIVAAILYFKFVFFFSLFHISDSFLMLLFLCPGLAASGSGGPDRKIC